MHSFADQNSLPESDSDSEIQAPTNRGNKLKQKAKFVREGKLGPPTGPSVYKEARQLPRKPTLALFGRPL